MVSGQSGTPTANVPSGARGKEASIYLLYLYSHDRYFPVSAIPSGDPTKRALAFIVFGYIPTRTPAIIAGVAYLVIGATLFLRLFRTKLWWGLCLPIGAFSEPFRLRKTCCTN
jgi:hypothetical protein